MDLQKIIPNLWFEDKAESAVNFYTSIFKNSKIKSISRYDAAAAEVAGMPEGSVMVISFELEGQEFSALNGGPAFKFNEAISFIINCNNQEEVDYFWNKLTENGEEGQCGWLKDKFGVSWQVIPLTLGELLSGKDTRKSQQAMAAMLKMKKINIEELINASETV